MLRRQRQGNNNPEANVPVDRNTIPMRGDISNQRRGQVMRTSHFYCLVSIIVAMLAIVTTSGNHTIPTSTVSSECDQSTCTNGDFLNRKDDSSIENIVKALTAAAIATGNEKAISQDIKNFDNTKDTSIFSSLFKKRTKKEETINTEQNEVPIFLRWIDSLTLKMKVNMKKKSLPSPKSKNESYTPLLSLFQSIVDDAILHPHENGGATRVIDKILTSTPRLLAIANLLLAVTYLLHSAVADLFLGSVVPIMDENGQNIMRNEFADDLRHRRAGRERLGGFLIFKLLLISAVVEPDTLDLLILLSWYTLLSFLRSLSHLAACTTHHTSQAGLPPRQGVVKLLLLVLCCNFTAAASCVALFHGAGFGMVLLLTCDCALLAFDVFVHLGKHITQVLDERHTRTLSNIEEQQIQLHNQQNTQDENQEQIRSLDRHMETNVTQHSRRIQILDKFIFTVELMTALLTICHFLHIWSLHGITFGLVDGVLLLHLHNAISAASRKIADRRNMYKISRDLDGFFEDASEQEIQKASMSGDVCCICLNSMCVGHVKKVGCGHLYHAHCLREVVERARSIEAAKCPLCRASLVNGNGDIANDDPPNPPDLDVNAQQHPQMHEHALFRFSTEGILPSWLPIPAFSFEVVRRPTMMEGDANVNMGNGPQVQQQPNNAQNPSFWRRLLVFTGTVPMSPEEENEALSQLVEMFPQYDRSALLRELRHRLSTEAVVESILMGTFNGISRGDGTNFVDPINEVNEIE